MRALVLTFFILNFSSLLAQEKPEYEACGKGRDLCIVKVDQQKVMRETEARLVQQYGAERVKNCAMNGNCSLSCSEHDPNPYAPDCGNGSPPPPSRKPKSSPKARAKSTGKNTQPTGQQQGETDVADKKEPKENDPTAAPQLPVGQLSQGTPSNRCDYDSGTPLRQRFNKLLRECESSSRKANTRCDLSASREIKEAMAHAKATSKKVSAAASSRQSLLQVCNKYTKSADRLKDALKSYQEACRPAKDVCENKCMSAGKSAQTIADNFSSNPNCYKSLGAMVNDLSSKTDSVNAKLQKCLGHRDPLQRARNDSKELLASMGRSNLCEKQSAETCRIDPNTGACIIKTGQSKEFLTASSIADFGAGGQGIEKQGNFDAHKYETNDAINANGVAGEGAQVGDEFVDFLPPLNKSGNGAIGAAGEQGKETYSGKKEGGAAGNGFYRNGRRRKKSKYKFSAYSFQSGKQGKKSRNAASDRNSKSAQYLKKFLPGGKKDPNREAGSDGITGAVGPGLFEKVTRRYRLHEPRMFQEGSNKPWN